MDDRVSSGAEFSCEYFAIHVCVTQRFCNILFKIDI